MRNFRMIILNLAFVSAMFAFAACGGNDDNDLQPNPPQTETPDNGDNNNQSNKMNIKIGNATFAVTLAENATTASLKTMLPMTLTMNELNGNEKYGYLSKNLPTAAENVNAIQTGDVMLFGSNCIVVFYKSFSTSYSYTRIGKIDNASQLASAVGGGDISATFELK